MLFRLGLPRIDRSCLGDGWLFLGTVFGRWQWGESLDADDALYLQATTMTWAWDCLNPVGTGIRRRTNRVSRFSKSASGQQVAALGHFV
jgi:hypothetical protein